MKTLIYLLLIGFTLQLARARVGETLEECEARYGKALSNKGDIFYFQKEPFEVAVGIWHGKAVWISYQKIEKANASGAGAPISDVQIRTLLNANDAGPWTVPTGAVYSWVVGEMNLSASYDNTSGKLVVKNNRLLALAAAEDDAKEAAKLSGF